MPASKLGLLSPPGQSTASAAIVQNVALKENILYAARGDIETTARLLSQVKTLQEEHVNPPYLRGDLPVNGWLWNFVSLNIWIMAPVTR